MIQQLHYEHIGGMLIRRNEMLHWYCPDCGEYGESKQAKKVCPLCKGKGTELRRLKREQEQMKLRLQAKTREANLVAEGIAKLHAEQAEIDQRIKQLEAKK